MNFAKTKVPVPAPPKSQVSRGEMRKPFIASLLLLLPMCRSQDDRSGRRLEAVEPYPGAWPDGDAWFSLTASEAEVYNLTITRLDFDNCPSGEAGLPNHVDSICGNDINKMWDVQFGQDGVTMLMSAASRQLLTVVTLLLERGAQINVTNALGWNALHFAAVGGEGAPIERTAEQNETSRSIVQALVAAGLSPLSEAGSDHDEDVHTHIVPHTHVERYTPIALAKLYGNEAAHDELLRRPQAPPGPPSIVQSILGDTEMIRWFSHTVGEEEVLALTTARLDSGVSPDTLWDDTDFEQYRITWLQSASVRRFESVVTLLLQRGANVSLTNGWGWTPLHFAQAQGADGQAV